MNQLTAFAGLAVFPAAALLRIEPVGLAWAYKYGKLRVRMPPLPPDLERRAARNDRIALFIMYGIVCGFIYVLSRLAVVPQDALGFRLARWPYFLVAGLGAGSICAVFQMACGGLVRAVSVRARARNPGFAPPVIGVEDLRKGSMTFHAARNIVGSFAEEYWRAFSLVALADLGHGAPFAVAATSLVFGLAHQRGGASLGARSSWYLWHTAFGVVFALLFLWSRSIIAVYAGHLLTNAVVLARARGSRQNGEAFYT